VRRQLQTDRPEYLLTGRRLVLAAMLLTWILLLPACSTTPFAPPAVADHIRSGTTAIPADDEQAIRTTVDRLNGTAGGAVADQQAQFEAAVDPSSAQALADCPAATTTLLFRPVYSGLRPTLGWAPQQGALTGTIYALPTLITIYTGDRVTATDLTTLHLGVADGEAFLTPLCVN